MDALQKLEETPETITAWADDTFGPTHPAAIARRMRFEVQELLDAWEVVGDVPVNELSPEVLTDLQGECGDIYIMLVQVARKLGMDLREAATLKMQVNRGRRWARDPISGTIRHVSNFQEPGSGLFMQMDRWYILSDSGSYYQAEGFASEAEALVWAKSPAGIEAGAGGAVVPVFLGPGKAWEGIDAANIFFARDLYDYWLAEGEFKYD